mmetsp:Transcript_7522/g.21399  ORF Transcript_7522/g.21399 Transcript_7522/m.21399 type:complete len:705 (+) Transcript_7522:72-2186(+)
MTDIVRKVNDRFEFYPVIDLAEFLSHKEADENGEKESTVFHLQAVLVHSGTMQGGHYYAYIRPNEGPNWFRFDDDVVKSATEHEAVDENFGSEEDKYNPHMRLAEIRRRYANAYMLIYVRDTAAKEILSEVSEIPPQLAERLRADEVREEEVRRKREEELSNMQLVIVDAAVLKEHDQSRFDLISPKTAKRTTFKKYHTLNHLKKQLYPDTAPEKIRFWAWINRQNKTTRPSRPYAPKDEDTELALLFRSRRYDSTPTQLYVEFSDREEEPFFDPFDNVSDCLTFFKYFNLRTGEMEYLGSKMFRADQKTGDFAPYCRELRGLPPDAPVVLYEEVKPSMVDLLDLKQTLDGAELGNGDIIAFEDDLPDSEREGLPFESTQVWYETVRSRRKVEFKDKDDPKEVAFTKELSGKMSYEDVSKLVGKEIGHNPQMLRFTGSTDGKPKPSPFRSCDRPILEAMLKSYLGKEKTLYFEKLDMTIEELERKKELDVFWQFPNAKSTDEILLAVDPDDTMATVVAMLQKKKPDLFKGTGRPLVVTHNYCHIAKVNPMTECVAEYIDSYRLRVFVLEAPEEVENLGDGKMALVTNYDLHQYYDGSHRVAEHSNPFVTAVKPGETVKEFKERMRARLEISAKQAEQWKISVMDGGRPTLTSDDHVLFDKVKEVVGLESEHVEVGIQRPKPEYHSYYRSHQDSRSIKFRNQSQD